jgi:hypothetical protein
MPHRRAKESPRLRPSGPATTGQEVQHGDTWGDLRWPPENSGTPPMANHLRPTVGIFSWLPSRRSSPTISRRRRPCSSRWGAVRRARSYRVSSATTGPRGPKGTQARPGVRRSSFAARLAGQLSDDDRLPPQRFGRGPSLSRSRTALVRPCATSRRRVSPRDTSGHGLRRGAR